MDYRNSARKALERAKKELSSDDEHRLRYAALELRMALEALIYERSKNYKDELPNENLGVWQPKRLLNLLLELDPYVDKSATIGVGVEEEYGKPAKDIQSLGTDRVLSLAEIKKYYDKIGSYLHTQTVEQVAQNKGPKPDGMRKRCNEIMRILEEVLSSPVFNADFKVTSSITCGNCGADIVRRIPPEDNQLIAKCIKCPATYDVIPKEDKTVDWLPRIHKVKCANSECKKPFEIWERELDFGSNWDCSKCNGNNTIIYALQYKQSAEEKQKKANNSME
jgi:hypothetical protein